MRIHTRELGPVVALAAVAACGSAEGWTGTVTDSASVTIVTNTDRGMWSEGAGWTLEEQLRIGALEVQGQM